MKNLRTAVDEPVFAALETAAVAEGKTLAAYVRRVLETHAAALGTGARATPSTSDRLDRQAEAIKRLRVQTKALHEWAVSQGFSA